MLFQYLHVSSSEDSKRHYEWKCLSTEDPHIFIILTPDSNRFGIFSDVHIIPTTQTITKLVESCSRTNQEHQSPQLFLNTIQNLLKRYPMIAHFAVRGIIDTEEIGVYNPFSSQEIWFTELLVVINTCQASILQLECDVLQFDLANRDQNGRRALVTEVTNAFGRGDLTCLLQSLEIKPKVEEKEVKEKEKETKNKRPFPDQGQTRFMKRSRIEEVSKQKPIVDLNLFDPIDMFVE